MAATFKGQPPTNGKGVQCESPIADGVTRCPNPPVTGMNVCRIHGGGAAKVQKAARERLAELVNPAIAKMAQAIRAKKNDKHIPFGQQTGAARWMMEVNGYKPTDQVVVTQQFDPTRFAHMTDDEIAQFVALGRKASRAVDAREGEPDGD